MEKAKIISSSIFVILAVFCEIGGGYLVWLWLEGGKSLWLGLYGALVLISMELFLHSGIRVKNGNG